MDNEAQPIEVPITITTKPDAAITRKPATKRKAASTKVTPKKGKTKAKTVAKKKPAKKAVAKANKPKGKPKAKGKARKPAKKSAKKATKTTGNKVGRPPRYLGDAQKQMRSLYATGLTLDGVGKKMKPSCTGQCVRHIFIRNGWKLRAKGFRFPKKAGKK